MNNNLIIKKMVTKIYPKQANGKYGQPQKVVEYVCGEKQRDGHLGSIGYGSCEQTAVAAWRVVKSGEKKKSLK